MKLLDEILNDYPRIWEFYRHDTGEKSRAPKFAQRYPLPIGTISMVVDFHKWTHRTAYLVASELNLAIPHESRRTEVGPSPIVMLRLDWLNKSWAEIERKRKSLARTLGDEIVHWHTRIRVKVNDGDIYAYQPSLACDRCLNLSVMAINDKFVCFNISCKDAMTGEWRTWQRT